MNFMWSIQIQIKRKKNPMRQVRTVHSKSNVINEKRKNFSDATQQYCRNLHKKLKFFRKQKKFRCSRKSFLPQITAGYCKSFMISINAIQA